MKIIQIFQILTVSQDTRRVSDDRQTYSEEKKAINGTGAFYPSDHQRSSRSTNAQSHLDPGFSHLGPKPLEIYKLVENFQGKNHFEPVPMVGGIRLIVVMKAWQWVW